MSIDELYVTGTEWDSAVMIKRSDRMSTGAGVALAMGRGRRLELSVRKGQGAASKSHDEVYVNAIPSDVSLNVSYPPFNVSCPLLRHLRCFANLSPSAQTSSMSSVSAANCCLSVTVHGLVYALGSSTVTSISR